MIKERNQTTHGGNIELDSIPTDTLTDGVAKAMCTKESRHSTAKPSGSSMPERKAACGVSPIAAS